VLIALLVLAACFVAFTNGANANFKGVASLYGSGTTTLRTALYWGTATTFAGSIAAAFLSHGLISRFSGRGIVAETMLQSPHFLVAVAVAAASTTFLATRIGFPVSTTHALVGALCGAGLVGSGSGIHLEALGSQFLYPLFFSPAIAALLGAGLYVVLRAARLAPQQRGPVLDALHFVSSGAASFARGLNDTPKMVALLSAVPMLSAGWGFGTIALMIAVGALLDADRVAETLGKKVTDMDPGQGFAASVATAALVTTASLHSLPVSTTHVSVGALLGIGVVTRQAKWRMIAEIMLAWLSTVPCAALLGAASYFLISRL
jgi:PiT family inorganic phosphate transporter